MAGSLELSDEGSRWLILGPAAVALHAAVFSLAIWGSGAEADCAPLPPPFELAVELPSETDETTPAIVNPESASVPHDGPQSDNAPTPRSSVPKATARPTSLSPRAPLGSSDQSESLLASALATAQLGPTEGALHANIARIGEGAHSDFSTSDLNKGNSNNGNSRDGSHGYGTHAVRSSTSARPAPASRPRLLSAASTCQGVLASAAMEMPAQVTIVLQVNKDGTASPKSVKTNAQPALPGLKAAVHSCARRLRFIPAQTETGERIQAASTIRLTIGGHYSAHAPTFGRNRQNHI